MVAIGVPATITRELTSEGVACPPCEHITVAPSCKTCPAMATSPVDLQSAVVNVDGRSIERDRGTLPVVDIDAAVVDDDRGAVAAFKHDAAGVGRSRRVAHHHQVLAGRQHDDVLTR